MKKLFYVAALSLASLTAFAQNSAEANIGAGAEVSTQDNYTEIVSSELPEAVTAAIARDYPTAAVNKAYVNKDKHYKLELVLKDGASGTLYADQDGNWIEM
ncbi:hypothetical protein SB49_13580 [Sediminicola sp. YIK13]|uniref:hypothetical protein n=1 Tax=Sediminicola sp. YIK13 TaxID=1453352 RepID=UPI0007222C7B|nr:hypothetical protein [Sediminicola sp. YIK13]ALM08725.1 hypothetical protein SB49_13580 [Sediminicola sp. YIK13]